MTVYIDAREPTPSSWLPGAHVADLEVDLSTPGDPAEGGRHPLPDLADWCATLGSWGIGPATRVVIYDARGGGMAAARVWWMLRAVGHTHVRVVDLSTLPADRTSEPSARVDGPAYPADAWQLPTVTAEELAHRLGDPDWVVLDARSAERFRGEVEPFDPVAGHIPGALNTPWEQAVDLDAARAQLARAIGDRRLENVIVHCGSGVTACFTLLQLERLGMGGASLYVGSWSEWCRRSHRTPGSGRQG